MSRRNNSAAEDTRESGRIDASSDGLAAARRLLEKHPEFQDLLDLFQVSVVIDANIVLSELIWLTRHRKNPDARTRLKEVLVNETIVAIAPEHLEIEVMRHLPRIAAEQEVDLGALRLEWAAYRKLIQFERNPEIPAELKRESIDHDDLPYSILASTNGFLVLTRDKHLKHMAAVMPISVVGYIQDYSRRAAVELTFVTAQTVMTGIGIATIAAVARLIAASVRGFRRMPDWIQFVLVGVIIATLLHPSSREFFATKFRSVGGRSQDILAEVLPALESFMDASIEAANQSDQALELVRQELAAIQPNKYSA